MLRSSADRSSEDPHANCRDNLERYKSDREVKVELEGGRSWGGGCGGSGEGCRPCDDPKGDCSEGKKT